MIFKTRCSKGKKLADALRRELSGLSTDGETPIASAHEIALQHQVSLPTAHNALNQLVREGLLYRIQGKGTFLKPQEEKRLRIGIADSTIFPLSEETQKLLYHHIEYVMDYLAKENCDTTLIAYPDLIKSASTLNKNFDALLVSVNYMDPNSIRILTESGLPVVIYRFESEGLFPFSQVYYDQNNGIAKAIAALEPAVDEAPVIVYEKTASGIASRKMWEKYLCKAGFSSAGIEYHEILTAKREISCYRLIRVHHKEFRNRILFTTNDDLAFCIISAFHDENMICGKDYRICGVGNHESDGAYFGGEPILSTVDRPQKLMAEESARLLLYLIKHPTKCRFSVRIPTDFILRQSGKKQTIKGGI